MQQVKTHCLNTPIITDLNGLNMPIMMMMMMMMMHFYSTYLHAVQRHITGHTKVNIKHVGDFEVGNIHVDLQSNACISLMYYHNHKVFSLLT